MKQYSNTYPCVMKPDRIYDALRTLQLVSHKYISVSSYSLLQRYIPTENCTEKLIFISQGNTKDKL